MKISRILAAAVFAAAFLVIAGCVNAAKVSEGDTTSSVKVSAKAPAKADRKVIVYYFHGDMRCTNCTNFEKYTDELMKTTFADAIKKGAIEWRVVNTDTKGNEHFMNDYQLVTNSLVLVDSKGNKQLKFKNLVGIWQTIGNKSKFQNYVQGEIQAFLSAQ